jgi:hypothetical protein
MRIWGILSKGGTGRSVLGVLRFVLDHLSGVLQVLAGPLDGLTGNKAQQGEKCDGFGHGLSPSMLIPETTRQIAQRSQGFREQG